MIRAFVGLALPEKIEDRLIAVQAGLPVGRAVKPGALHITLVFLGPQREPVLEDLHVALSALTAPPLTLRLRGLGLFGGARPRTLHAEVVPDPDLKALRKRVAAEARGVGIEVPRERFVPHVTLARFGAGMAEEDLDSLHRFLATRLALQAGPFRVDRLTLFRAHLRPDGAEYDALAEYPLEEGPA